MRCRRVGRLTGGLKVVIEEFEVKCGRSTHSPFRWDLSMDDKGHFT